MAGSHDGLDAAGRETLGSGDATAPGRETLASGGASSSSTGSADPPPPAAPPVGKKRFCDMTPEEFREAGLTFNRDGEFARKDKAGRLMKVDEWGVIYAGRREKERPDGIPPRPNGN